jgi:hypothetical protein
MIRCHRPLFQPRLHPLRKTQRPSSFIAGRKSHRFGHRKIQSPHQESQAFGPESKGGIHPGDLVFVSGLRLGGRGGVLSGCVSVVATASLNRPAGLVEESGFT